jgi:hypothetical protein
MMRTGSHVNAKFKGKHDDEFAWFAASAGAPLISMNADRAARKFSPPCRRASHRLRSRSLRARRSLGMRFSEYHWIRNENCELLLPDVPVRKGISPGRAPASEACARVDDTTR